MPMQASAFWWGIAFYGICVNRANYLQAIYAPFTKRVIFIQIAHIVDVTAARRVIGRLTRDAVSKPNYAHYKSRTSHQNKSQYIHV